MPQPLDERGEARDGARGVVDARAWLGADEKGQPFHPTIYAEVGLTGS